MVLTEPVRTSETGHTRRRLLGGAVLGAVSLAPAGCGLFDDDEPAPPAAPDPLQPLLDEAVALATAYDRAVVTQPRLTARLAPLAADHREHAAELARLIGTPPPSAVASVAPAASSSPSVTVADLRTAEQAAQRNAAAACRQAPADRATLLGSIAACRATHAEALR